MNEQLLKTSGTDGLSFRKKKTQKNILLSCNFRLASDATATSKFRLLSSEFRLPTSANVQRCNFLPSVFTFSNMAVANEKTLEMR